MVKIKQILFCFGVLALAAVGLDINNFDELKQLSERVNKGTSYSGETVYLLSDIDITSEFTPIGNYIYTFQGTFEGNGHVIRNLKVTQSLKQVGLIGFSNNGTTVRNIIIDSGSAITSTHTGDSTYVGGIVGYCLAADFPCKIENSISLASLSYSGVDVKRTVYYGGIYGCCFGNKNDCVVRNSVNYGTITISGEISEAMVGGIIGRCAGMFPYSCTIENSLNYGKLSVSSTSVKNINVGGISGNDGSRGRILNCVNAGELDITANATKNNRIGSIAGFLSSTDNVKNVFWSEEDLYPSFGYLSISENLKISKNLTYNRTYYVKDGRTTISLIKYLNSYSRDDQGNLSRWTLNRNLTSSITFDITSNIDYLSGEKTIIPESYPITLLPRFASYPSPEPTTVFYGWFKDANHTKVFCANSFVEKLTLYGLWGDYQNVSDTLPDEDKCIDEGPFDEPPSPGQSSSSSLSGSVPSSGSSSSHPQPQPGSSSETSQASTSSSSGSESSSSAVSSSSSSSSTGIEVISSSFVEIIFESENITVSKIDEMIMRVAKCSKGEYKYLGFVVGSSYMTVTIEFASKDNAVTLYEFLDTMSSGDRSGSDDVLVSILNIRFVSDVQPARPKSLSSCILVPLALLAIIL